MLQGMFEIMQTVLGSVWLTVIVAMICWTVILTLLAEMLGLIPERRPAHERQGRPYNWAVDGL